MDMARDAVHVLKSFFHEMNAWERESRAVSRRIASGESDVATSHSERERTLKQILSSFCTSDDCSTRGIRYQHPPEYDGNRETILRIEDVGIGQVRIYTRQLDGWKHERVFTLQCNGTEWRISRKQRIRPDGSLIDESI
jgi:hypothetical protein